jgi:hypothetical protein
MSETTAKARKAFAKAYPSLKRLLLKRSDDAVTEVATPQWQCVRQYVETIIFYLCSGGAKFETSNDVNGEIKLSNLQSLITDATNHLCVRLQDVDVQKAIRLLQTTIDCAETEEMFEAKLDIAHRLDIGSVIPLVQQLHWQSRDIVDDILLLCCYEAIEAIEAM